MANFNNSETIAKLFEATTKIENIGRQMDCANIDLFGDPCDTSPRKRESAMKIQALCREVIPVIATAFSHFEEFAKLNSDSNNIHWVTYVFDGVLPNPASLSCEVCKELLELFAKGIYIRNDEYMKLTFKTTTAGDLDFSYFNIYHIALRVIALTTGCTTPEWCSEDDDDAAADAVNAFTIRIVLKALNKTIAEKIAAAKLQTKRDANILKDFLKEQASFDTILLQTDGINNNESLLPLDQGCNEAASTAHILKLRQNDGRISVSAANVTEPLPNKRFVNVPPLNAFYRRVKDEQAIFEGIYSVIQNGGFFCVEGAAGFGKTTLVSQVLNDPSNDMISATIWLNCYQFKGVQGEDDFFKNQLLKLGNELVNQQFSSIHQMVMYFKENGMPLLIVLDDVINDSPIHCLRQESPSVSCCVITRHTSLKDITKSHVIDPLSDKDILQILKDVQKSTGHQQITNFPVITNYKRGPLLNGMPLLVTMIACALKRGLLTKSFSDDMKDMRNWAISSNSRGEKTVQDFFQNMLSDLNEEQRRRYYAFLLVGPREPVSLEDLTLLWHCKEEIEARQICKRFVRAAVVSCMDEQTSLKTRFCIHQLFYEAAADLAKKELLISDIDLDVAESKLHFRLIADCSDSADRECNELLIASFFSNLIKQKKQDLLTTIMKNIKRTDFLNSSVDITNNIDVGTRSIASKIAAATGHIKLVEMFIVSSTTGPVELKDDDETPMIIAAQNGHWEIVKLLAARDPKAVKSKDSDGGTPLSYALKSKRCDVIALFVERYPNLLMEFKNRKTALMKACETGDLESVRIIADVAPNSLTQRDRDGCTCLSYAARYGYLEVVEFIVERCPDIVTQPNEKGETAMSYASINEHWDVVTFLAEIAPTTIKEVNCYGDTPMMQAAECGKLEIVKLLAKIDPSAIDQVNNEQETPLKLAEFRGMWEVVKFLASHSSGSRDLITC